MTIFAVSKEMTDTIDGIGNALAVLCSDPTALQHLCKVFGQRSIGTVLNIGAGIDVSCTLPYFWCILIHFFSVVNNCFGDP